jgi:hypothetical protein
MSVEARSVSNPLFNPSLNFGYFYNPGSETERAHLLTTVAYNLRMKSDYYKDATLSYSVRKDEALHRLLLDVGQGIIK